MKMGRLLASVVVTGAAALSAMAYAADMNTAQKQQIQAVVRDYIMSNPQVLVESLQGYQQKQMSQARDMMQKTQDSSPRFADALFHQANDPTVGSANAKITVVEFFDYQCPHCVDMTQVMDDLVASNPNVRVVFKEFPIRGPMSEYAAKAALAAKEQGKYFEFHKALMGSKQQPLTEDLILGFAKSTGLDIDKWKAAMNSPAVQQQLKANYKLAQELKLLGTPAIFIAKSNVSKASPATAIVFIPGQVDKAQMNQLIQKITQ